MISGELKSIFTNNRAKLYNITKKEYPTLYKRFFKSKGEPKKLALFYLTILQIIENQEIIPTNNEETHFLLSASRIIKTTPQINTKKQASYCFHYLCHIGFIENHTRERKTRVRAFTNRISIPKLTDNVLRIAEQKAIVVPSKTSYKSLLLVDEDTSHYKGIKLHGTYLNEQAKAIKADCEKIETRLINRAKRRKYAYLTREDIHTATKAYFDRENEKRLYMIFDFEEFIQAYLRPYLLASNKLTYTRYPTKEQQELFHLKDRKKAIYTLCVDDDQK